MKQLLLLLFLGFALNLQGQQGRVLISGQVLDSLRSPLTGATVILMHAQDSLMEAFAIADKEGSFILEANDPDEYILQITYVGYGSFARKLIIEAGQEDVDFGDIVLSLSGYSLGEVTVEDSFIPIIIKKDTIEYNAAAFPTPEGAVVEDLLKRLPGVEVDQDGTIRAHGEEVENVMVDGKPFFENDPKVATQNIPADLVDRVQVFDQQSDFSEFTGIDDGQGNRSINLQIKDGQNKGTFGNLNAGYGLEDRYKASANVNRFTDEMQLSLLGNINNINERAFSFEEYLQFIGGWEELMSGGMVDFSEFPTNLIDNSGITTGYSGGLNYNYDFNKKTSLRSNYFYNGSENATLSDSYVESILSDGFFTTNSQSDESTNLGNHRFRGHLKHDFDDTQDLQIRGSVSLFNNETNYFGESQSSFGDQLANNTIRSNISDLKGLSWKSSINYRKKFDKKGRFLILDGKVDGRESNGLTFVDNQIFLFDGPVKLDPDSIQQQQIVLADGLSVEGKVDYVEPFGETNFLRLSASSFWVDNFREKTFSDLINTEEYQLNQILSGALDRTLNQNTIGTAWKMLQKKWNGSVGIDFQQTYLESLPNNGISGVERTFYNWLPNARFEYTIDASSSMEFDYSSNIRAPSPEQLQPVLDNSDAFNVYQGNPVLRPERVSSFDLNFNSFNQFYLRAIFIGLQTQFIQDRIIDASNVDDQLRRIIQPVNSRNEWMTNGFYDFSAPVKGIDLKVGVNGTLRFQRSNFLVNDQLDLFNIWDFNQTVRIENKDKEKWDVGIGYRLHLTRTAFDINEQLNLPYNDQSIFADLYWYAPGNWTFNVNVRYQVYSKARERMGADFIYLDTGVRKSFFNRQLTIYLKGTNLLDEQLIFNRQSFGNQLMETAKNRFGRVLLLGAIYKIRSFGK